jgi:hypothetical protein
MKITKAKLTQIIKEELMIAKTANVDRLIENTDSYMGETETIDIPTSANAKKSYKKYWEAIDVALGHLYEIRSILEYRGFYAGELKADIKTLEELKGNDMVQQDIENV